MRVCALLCSRQGATMPRVSELYALDVDQGGLDFVDVLVETDNPVYVDPAALL